MTELVEHLRRQAHAWHGESPYAMAYRLDLRLAADIIEASAAAVEALQAGGFNIQGDQRDRAGHAINALLALYEPTGPDR